MVHESIRTDTPSTFALPSARSCSPREWRGSSRDSSLQVEGAELGHGTAQRTLGPAVLAGITFLLARQWSIELGEYMPVFSVEVLIVISFSISI
jgi:hypothetical protein